MSLIKTEAIILRVVPYHETSSIVRVFTKDAGVVSLIAKGARRLKSPFRGYLEPFNCVEIVYYHKPTREIQTLASVELLRAFFANFTEVDRLVLPYSVLEYLEKFTAPEDENLSLFRLTIGVFELMETELEMMELYFAWFLFGFSSIHGYEVSVASCVNCGKELKRAYYDTMNGKFYCDGCSYLVGRYFLFLNSNILRALNLFAKGDVETVREFCVREDVLRLIKFLMLWVGFHFGVGSELKSFKVFSMIKKDVEEKR